MAQKRIDEAIVRAAFQAYLNGATYKQLREQFGYHPETLRDNFKFLGLWPLRVSRRKPKRGSDKQERYMPYVRTLLEWNE